MICVKSNFVFRELFNNSRNLLNLGRCISIGGSNVSTKSIEEKIGLPPKPKKPLTPYFRFMKQMRPIVASENPKASTIDVVKIIATKWKTVDSDSKKKLEDEYKKEQISYIEKCAKYDNKLTESQKDDIKQLKKELAEAKERKALKKRVKELGRPKKPPSAFLKFILNERSTAPPPHNLPYTDWIKKVTEKWSRLSETEKEKYKAEAKKEFEKYKQEFSKWENKMIRLGHIDVVRQSALIDPEMKLKKKA